MTRPAAEKPCCIRCGSLFGAGTHLAVTANMAVPEPVEDARAVDTVAIRAPLSTFDTWELEEQLRHVDRILAGARFATELRANPAASPGGANAAPQAPTDSPAAPVARRAKPYSARSAWAMVASGAAALVCGLVLLSAGALLGRQTWQSLGLPITLLGQVALLLGMVMQLDLVWQGKRATASKLYRFQKRLVDLESLAAEIAPTDDSVPAPAGDEQALLADLKCRLDTLSHKLNSPCA